MINMKIQDIITNFKNVITGIYPIKFQQKFLLNLINFHPSFKSSHYKNKQSYIAVNFFNQNYKLKTNFRCKNEKFIIKKTNL